MSNLLVHNTTMVSIKDFSVCIQEFCNLIVFNFDFNKFTDQTSKSRPITATDIILILISSNFRSHITSQGFLGKVIFFFINI